MKTLNDLTTSAPVERKLLEKDVQKKCVDWARARGYWARKFSSQSQRSVPDYLFAGAKRKLGMHKCRHASISLGSCTCCAWTPALKFATEFKRPGQTSTAAQLDEQAAMRAAGWYVFECDNLESFRRIVVNYEQDNWI
jgi:hypothetical protein